MRKSRKIAAFLSALCLMSFSSAYIPCEYLADYITASAASDETATEETVNNTKTKAQVIETGTPVTSSLVDNKDIDWYKFSLESDGYFKFNFEHEVMDSSGTYWNIEVYESDGATLVHTISVAGNNNLTSSANIGIPKGDYYIKISSPAYWHSDIEYILSTSFTKSDTFETEDNDSKNNADIIDFNTEYIGSLMDKDDNDWYKFTVDKQGYIDISFTHDTLESTSVYWIVNIYKSDGTTLINSLEVKGSKETSSFPSMSLAEGDYYIKVTHDYYSSNMDYTFSVNFTEDDTWETEINNTKADANVISTDTLYNGTIMNGNDIDFYKFTLDEAKVLNIDFEHDTIDDDTNYWNIGIYQSDGTTSVYSFSSAGNSAITKSASVSLGAGDYYLKITPRNSSYYNTMKYQFTINSKTAENWETEVNNTKNTANAIDLNTTYNSSIMGSDDVDWFSFSTEKDGYISLDFEHDTIESTNTYWIAEVYESDATTLIHSLDIKGNSALTSSPSIGLPAGDYFVKIKPYSDYYWSNMDTQFTINYTESVLWETEDNDSKANADTININTTYGGSIMTYEDADWYKFDVDEDKKLKVVFENPGVGDKKYEYWKIYVYESDGSTSVTSQEVSGETPEVSFDADFTKGTYYIKVVYGGYYYSTSDYSITVSDDVAIKGDIDNDGTVTTLDALAVLKMVASISEVDIIADMDGDGEVTSLDALKILQYSAGLIESL